MAQLRNLCVKKKRKMFVWLCKEEVEFVERKINKISCTYMYVQLYYTHMYVCRGWVGGWLVSVRVVWLRRTGGCGMGKEAALAFRVVYIYGY